MKMSAGSTLGKTSNFLNIYKLLTKDYRLITAHFDLIT